MPVHKARIIIDKIEKRGETRPRCEKYFECFRRIIHAKYNIHQVVVVVVALVMGLELNRSEGEERRRENKKAKTDRPRKGEETQPVQSRCPWASPATLPRSRWQQLDLSGLIETVLTLISSGQSKQWVP